MLRSNTMPQPTQIQPTVLLRSITLHLPLTPMCLIIFSQGQPWWKSAVSTNLHSLLNGRNLFLFCNLFISINDEIHSAINSSQLMTDRKIKIFGGKVHQIDDSQELTSNYFEIWLKINPRFGKATSKFLGLFQCPSLASLPPTIPIFDPLKNMQIGTALVSISIHQTEEIAKKWLVKTLTSQSVQTLLQEKMVFDDPSIQSEILSTTPETGPDKPHEIVENETISSPVLFDINSESEDIEFPIAPPKISSDPPLNLTRVERASKATQISDIFDGSIDSLEVPHGKLSDQHPIDPQPFCEDHLNPQSLSENSVDSIGSESILSDSQIQSNCLHVLELTVIGSTGHAQIPSNSLGFFVCYDFPGLPDDRSNVCQ
jgi:hypothetical protein